MCRGELTPVTHFFKPFMGVYNSIDNCYRAHLVATLFFNFSPRKFGKMIQLDQHFSNGLVKKPRKRSNTTNPWNLKMMANTKGISFCLGGHHFSGSMFVFEGLGVPATPGDQVLVNKHVLFICPKLLMSHVSFSSSPIPNSHFSYILMSYKKRPFWVKPYF